MIENLNSGSFKNLLLVVIVVIAVFIPKSGYTQQNRHAGNISDRSKNSSQLRSSKKISPDLFGVFFEDLSFAADGGLYAELIQNRSFEYSLSDRKNWNPLFNWEFTNHGHGYGTVSVETNDPINSNNPHYVVLDVEEPGQEGVGLTNSGYDGIVLKSQEHYNFSVYIKQLSAVSIPMEVQLRGEKGIVYGEFSFKTISKGWKKYTGVILADQNADSAKLTIVAKSKSKLAIDEVSLFPQKTYNNEPNGLRADLVQAVANLKPKFVRFPGGCLVHGEGIANMYRWKNTIGPVEQRVQQRNIWNYHQSVGLGFYEYFRFCEDIGAKPVPVVAAGVSCQGAGGTWANGGTGQQSLPMSEMKNYIQDILDLIEYANGPVTSVWGAKRAAAGHPGPFHLQYIGIGNEDKQNDAFRVRFEMIYKAIKSKHPEITVIGTVGPFPSGDEFNSGWKFADRLAVPVEDEHFYKGAKWFLANNHRYDDYNRQKSQVYIGEYAAGGNALINALSEAAFMTGLERNGDIVKMASYAPLLANLSHLNWNPDLIYFNNKAVLLTANYYVQQLFSENQGNTYFPDIVRFNKAVKDSTLASSCVRDNKTGDVILKIINAGADSAHTDINLTGFDLVGDKVSIQILKGAPTDKNTIDQPRNVVPVSSEIPLGSLQNYLAPAYSLSVIRIKSKIGSNH